MMADGNQDPPEDAEEEEEMEEEEAEETPPVQQPSGSHPAERSGHVAVSDGQRMFVWGGYKNAPVWGQYDFYLPRDEIWICDMETHRWRKKITSGEIPPSMSGSCAACLNRTMYLFGGHHAHGNTNELYVLDLSPADNVLEWNRTECKGVPPSEKDKLGVWVYKNRLIFFGGYGYFREDNVGDFEFDETSFGNAGPPRGWNNHVHVLDPDTFTWQRPITSGKNPSPRAAHACAAVGNRGYVFGGRYQDSRLNDLYYLNFDTWEWTQVKPQGECPVGRSWHSLTRISSDCLFLFGGFTTDKQPLSDAWLFSVQNNQWIRCQNSFPDKARLWHTACASKEGEVIVFGGCANNLLAHHKAAHSNETLVFNVQPKSLVRKPFQSELLDTSGQRRERTGRLGGYLLGTMQSWFRDENPGNSLLSIGTNDAEGCACLRSFASVSSCPAPWTVSQSTCFTASISGLRASTPLVPEPATVSARGRGASPDSTADV